MMRELFLTRLSGAARHKKCPSGWWRPRPELRARFHRMVPEGAHWPGKTSRLKACPAVAMTDARLSNGTALWVRNNTRAGGPDADVPKSGADTSRSRNSKLLAVGEDSSFGHNFGTWQMDLACSGLAPPTLVLRERLAERSGPCRRPKV